MLQKVSNCSSQTEAKQVEGSFEVVWYFNFQPPKKETSNISCAFEIQYFEVMDLRLNCHIITNKGLRHFNNYLSF